MDGGVREQSQGTQLCYLDSKISEHRHRFQAAFPQQTLIPKHHFLEHYPHYPLLQVPYAPMSQLAKLRIILQDHDIRKLDLPHGIPATVAELESIVRETFELNGNFALHYKDAGETEGSLENERLNLFDEVNKRDNHQTITEKMAKTFSIRRQEIVNEAPAVSDLIGRWPVLFDAAQINEEFSRISTINLAKLDQYSPK
ncbi:hypothetical protein AALO_G00078850 [Alosa alosa]|uniref:Uncharacterized protein n=1 Tax=Alosa alosa TaxID=278164 RepID=A0AAV6GWP0_9TELE|nr:hypothetical protein AALO_G00078850 [Alosa alosa]